MAIIKGAVVVDKDKCKGCELCTVACPKEVLALSKEVNVRGYNYAFMKNPQECIGCSNCAMVCPDAVITVYRKKIE